MTAVEGDDDGLAECGGDIGLAALADDDRVQGGLRRKGRTREGADGLEARCGWAQRA
jgi:hypothetical protein